MRLTRLGGMIQFLVLNNMLCTYNCNGVNFFSINNSCIRLYFIFLFPLGFSICKKCHDSWSCKLTLVYILVYLITYSFAIVFTRPMRTCLILHSCNQISAFAQKTFAYSFVLVLRCRLTILFHNEKLISSYRFGKLKINLIETIAAPFWVK